MSIKGGSRRGRGFSLQCERRFLHYGKISIFVRPGYLLNINDIYIIWQRIQGIGKEKPRNTCKKFTPFNSVERKKNCCERYEFVMDYTTVLPF